MEPVVVEEVKDVKREHQSFYIKHRGREYEKRNMFGQTITLELKEEKNLLVLHINGQPMMTTKLYVAKSRLVPRQWGLFAARRFSKGDDLVSYDGDKISQEMFDQNERFRAEGYFLRYPENYISERRGKRKKGEKNLVTVGINAYPYVMKNPLKRLAGFANHSSQPNAETEPRYNAGDDLVLKLVALKDIKRGEEILWNYGSDYWGGDFTPVDLSHHFSLLSLNT
jgi:SET domain-containing protein